MLFFFLPILRRGCDFSLAMSALACQGHTAIELWENTDYDWIRVRKIDEADKDGEEKAALVAHIEGLFSDLK